VLAAVALTVYLLPEKSHPVAWRDLSARAGLVTTSDSTRRLFRTRSQLQQFLGTDEHVPVAFSRQQLLLVAPGPRSSTGYSIQVLSVTERDGAITVKVRERTPSLHDRVAARVTYPFRLLSLPAGKDVYVDWAGR